MMQYKKILLLFVFFGVMPVIFAGESGTEKPSVLTEGLNTVLIPGAASIKDHYGFSLHDYLLYREHREGRHFVAMNQIPIFNKNGHFITTLGEVRAVFNPKDPISGQNQFTEVERQGHLNRWSGLVMPEIMNNNAVKFPNVVPQQDVHGVPRELVQILTGTDPKLPAIVIGTTDHNICEKIKEYYENR